MEKTADFEIWRQIPPEEKLQILSRAQANGVFTCVITIIIASTLAVGLRLPWLLWSSIIIAPLMFQLAAGKAWRALRPRIMLEYLAARSAARRYAFTANARDLGISMLFRGEMQEIFDSEDQNLNQALESMTASIGDAAVWIALFNDALVVLEERKGGASCQFAALLNDKMSLQVKNGSEDTEYTNDKEVYVSVAADKSRPARKVKITSRYPAALVVFEKKLQQVLEQSKNSKVKELLPEFEDLIEAQSDY